MGGPVTGAGRQEPMDHERALDLAAGYVLHALDPSEEQAVRDHLATCPLDHTEFFDLGAVVPTLAEAIELVEPPASLKERIMAAAAADLEARRAGAPAPAEAERGAPPPERVRPFPTAEERERRRAGAGTWLLRIAAVLAIVALGASNLYLLSRPQPEDPFAVAVERVLEAATQPGSLVAVLGPAPDTGGDDRGLAAVTADGSIVIAMEGLTATTGTEVYEAWVIAGEAPIPVGEMRVGADGIAVATLTNTGAQGGVTLALSREPTPDSTTPTTVVAVGVVPTPPPPG
jgi:hypothetical protein